MNRRRFLSFLGVGAVGVAVAPLLPAAPPIAEFAPQFLPEGPVAYSAPLRGLTYLVTDSGSYLGLSMMAGNNEAQKIIDRCWLEGSPLWKRLNETPSLPQA